MNTSIESPLGIIGYPIGHSISPVFQQAALDYLKINAEYRAYEVNPGDVGRFVDSLRSESVYGINVTVPHKEAVIAHLDEIDDWAAEAGAVNTIVNRNGRLAGYNTDGYGFLRALRESGGLEPAGKNALILGAGGSARGVVQALLRADIASLAIANRTLARAQSLADMARSRGVPAEAMPLDSAQINDAAHSADLIVNCTSLGMTHGPDEGASPLRADQIPPAALVYDLVYNPALTPLFREAGQVGTATLGGITMLVYQGAASFEIWLERPAPVVVMMDAAMGAMREREQEERSR
ncbi:MAG: shikimate dehydrogenase [Chloroflexi bacterium]|nr:shikimate dehydrogenase [Chloroflexota bacterium]